MGNRWLESVRSGYGVLEIMFGSFVTVAQALNQIVFRDETRGIRSCGGSRGGTIEENAFLIRKQRQ